MFLQCAPPEFFTQLKQEFGLHDQGIYTMPVAIWLMVWQGLCGATTAEAVQQVVLGEPRRLLSAHKRLVEGTVSSNTGAYSVARKALPRQVFEKVLDRVFQQTLKSSPEAGWASRVYLLDGSTLSLAHTPELAQAFPPTWNQRGASHWPIIRVVVAHSLVNGAAVLPQWGPMNGKRAVSEQSLAETLLGRLPRQSTLVGDRNFGVFSVTWAAHRRGHDVIVRMTKARAQRLYGGTLPKRNADCWISWTPSRDDRRKHRELPADAAVHGRLIVQHVRRYRQTIVLYLFTTLELPVEQIVELYGRRWYIETDLRSIKHVLKLERLHCKSPEMVAKELIAGILAYNLARAVQTAAAQWSGVPCRLLSFAQVLAVTKAWLPRLLAVASPDEFGALLEPMLRAVAQCRLPKRKRRRRYPRAVWGRPQVFPRQKPRKTRGGRSYGKK